MGSQSDWIEWAGGECPVSADTLVNIRTADGDKGWEENACPAGVFAETSDDFDLNWWHAGNFSHDWRIIAYRIVGDPA